MTQTSDQKIAKLTQDLAKLDKTVRLLVVHVQRLEKENQRLKYAIGRTSRDLSDTQSRVAKGLK